MATIFVESKKRQAADLLLIPFWKGKKGPELASKEPNISQLGAAAITAKDFEGKEGEMALVYLEKQPESKAILLGLGEKEQASAEKLRRAYGGVCKWAHKQKTASHWNVLFPNQGGKNPTEILRGLVEGILIPNSSSECQKKEKPKLVETVKLYGSPANTKEIVQRACLVMEGVYFARTLVNGNADTVTPTFLAEQAKEIAKGNPSVKTTILNFQEIKKQKLLLLANVGRAGAHEPKLILLEYRGDPHSKEWTALIGKGITYDTGGLNLKPTGFMETMKSDMSGGAAILATLRTLAALKWKKNVVALVPAAENAIDANSYKPGDVYTSFSGKTVEIGNTDAEGRLVLADAISYAKKKYNLKQIVDIATLTGACVIALGTEAIALFSNTEKMAKAFEEAGDETFERVWRMPLYEEYAEMLKSDIADIKNIGKGRQAGAVVAAKFIQEFVGDTPWVHLDIAGKGYFEEAKRYFPKYGTGIGVRLLIHALEKL